MEKYEFIKLMLQKRNLSVNEKKRLLVLATREIEQNSNAENISDSRRANKPRRNVTRLTINNINENNDKVQNAQCTSKYEHYEKKVELQDKEQGSVLDEVTINKKTIKHRRGVEKKYISPSILNVFLARYRADDILKNTCHLIDDDSEIERIKSECHTDSYDLEQHSLLIEKKFNSLLEEYKKEFPDITYSKMIPLIRAYITGKDYNGASADWSTLMIGTNWKSQELLDWGKRFPGTIPIPGKNIARRQHNNGYQLPKRILSNLSDEFIRDMGGLVLYFKGLFHIKRDNSLKKIIINNKNIKKDDDGNYSYSIDEGKAIIHFSDTNFYESIELLTDVDKLTQAFHRVVKICIMNQSKQQFGNTTNIDLSFYEEDGHTFFCIHHTNSIYGKSARNATEQIGQEQGLLITNQINGLCDLFIEAVFEGDKYYRINLWDEKPKMEYTRIDPIQGVKYIMRF